MTRVRNSAEPKNFVSIFIKIFLNFLKKKKNFLLKAELRLYMIVINISEGMKDILIFPVKENLIFHYFYAININQY